MLYSLASTRSGAYHVVLSSPLGGTSTKSSDITVGEGRWARFAPFGGWSFLHIPYPLGEFTNLVSRGGKVSKSEIDYVLLGEESSFLVEKKGVLCISFTLPALLVSPKNPAEKILNFKWAGPSEKRSLSACLALLLCLNPETHPDALLPKFHSMAAQLLPRPSARAAISEAPLLRELELQVLQGNPNAAVQVEQWRQQMRDKASLADLGLSRVEAQATSPTSINSKNFRLRSPCFQTIYKVSPDGVFFPSTRDGFLREARSQALEFYGLRKLRMDTSLLSLDPVDPLHHQLVRDQLSIPDCFLHLSLSPASSDYGHLGRSPG